MAFSLCTLSKEPFNFFRALLVTLLPDWGTCKIPNRRKFHHDSGIFYPNLSYSQVLVYMYFNLTYSATNPFIDAINSYSSKDNKVSNNFIKGQAMGKWTSYEDDLTLLACPYRESSWPSSKSQKCFSHVCKSVVLLLEMLMAPLTFLNY